MPSETCSTRTPMRRWSGRRCATRMSGCVTWSGARRSSRAAARTCAANRITCDMWSKKSSARRLRMARSRPWRSKPNASPMPTSWAACRGSWSRRSTPPPSRGRPSWWPASRDSIPQRPSGRSSWTGRSRTSKSSSKRCEATQRPSRATRAAWGLSNSAATCCSASSKNTAPRSRTSSQPVIERSTSSSRSIQPISISETLPSSGSKPGASSRGRARRSRQNVHAAPPDSPMPSTSYCQRSGCRVVGSRPVWYRSPLPAPKAQRMSFSKSSSIWVWTRALSPKSPREANCRA